MKYALAHTLIALAQLNSTEKMLRLQGARTNKTISRRTKKWWYVRLGIYSQFSQAEEESVLGFMMEFLTMHAKNYEQVEKKAQLLWYQKNHELRKTFLTIYFGTKDVPSSGCRSESSNYQLGRFCIQRTALTSSIYEYYIQSVKVHSMKFWKNFYFSYYSCFFYILHVN